jgi:hypothetical protein
MSQDFSLVDRYSTVLEEIKHFIEGEEISKHISLEELNQKERCQIYNILETHYCEQLQYEKQSTFHGAHKKQVVLVLTKIIGPQETKTASVQVDDSVIHYFCKYNRLPLPLGNHKFIDYVLNLLDPYTNCIATFAQFLQDIEKYETVNKLNGYIDRVIDSILRHITEHPSTQTFKTNTFEMEMAFLKSSLYKTRCAFYTKENQEKLFISIDINKADYTILKHYHPEVFRDLPTWQEFVQSFCNEKPIHTLIHSKHLRERIFGDARITKKAKSLAEYFVHKVLHEMKINPADVMMLSGDEAVISYDPLTFRSMFDRYHNSFFKVLAFRLVKLPKYDYFVKEYFDPFQISDDQQIIVTYREFKCIPLPYIMQCIKQYEGKPILEVDRKFLTESGRVATLDESIF